MDSPQAFLGCRNGQLTCKNCEGEKCAQRGRSMVNNQSQHRIGLRNSGTVPGPQGGLMTLSFSAGTELMNFTMSSTRSG